MELNLNEQEQNRRNALVQMRELGIEPYPAAMYPVNATTEDIRERYNPEEGNFQEVAIAGRIMSRRIMGAAAFIELMDEKGRVQVYVKRDEICPGEDKTLYNTVFKKLLDIGDIDGAQKATKMYDSLMKSGKWTAAQIKEDEEDIVEIGRAHV